MQTAAHSSPSRVVWRWCLGVYRGECVIIIASRDSGSSREDKVTDAQGAPSVLCDSALVVMISACGRLWCRRQVFRDE